MSSLFVNDVVKKSSKETKESLTGSLLDGKNYEYKSRIHKPIAMAAFDLVAFHFSNTEAQKILYATENATTATGTVPTSMEKRKVRCGDYLFYLGKRIRVNGISEDGLSRKEAVTAMGGLISEEAKSQKVLTSFFS